MASFRPYNLIKDGYVADYVSAVEIYHGFYNPDTQSIKMNGAVVDITKAQFLISKETRNGSGNTTAMKWAYTTGQAMTYNQIWNDRYALTYL